MKRTNLKRTLDLLSAAGLAVVTCFVQSSCSDLWSEQHPGSYYINSGETVASFLEEGEYKESFTDFVYILKKANIWGELRTYGEHTCFAPDNYAIQEYLQQRYKESPDSIKHYFESVESLPEFICDSIAKTHLCNTTFFCTDMNGDGAFPYPNLLDRFLTYYSFADTTYYQDENGKDTFNISLGYKVNQMSRIVEADDTVQNGVVHIIDKVLRPSNKWLPGLLKENNEKAEYRTQANRYYEALMATGLNFKLEEYFDASYPTVGYDSTLACFRSTKKTACDCHTSYEQDWGVFPEKRYFKFTMFIVPDSILEEKYNITDLTGLRQKAIEIYPEGQSFEDTDPHSSLYKFMSYHILPEWLTYDQLTTTQPELYKDNRKFKDELDQEDFYETMQPHSIMRISAPFNTSGDGLLGIYINRKGTTSSKKTNFIPGIRIWQLNEYGDIDPTCLNGGYHYIDDMLLYDKTTREDALNVRMRIMAATLSPDFINSGSRGRLRKTDADRYVTGFLKGFCTNFEALNDVTQFWVRYRDQSFGTLNGDEMTVRGTYDIAVKLPPVPSDGTYEIRMWNNSMAGTGVGDRGVVQFYFCKGDENKAAGNWEPCGIPVDLRIAGDNPKVGYIKDSELTQNIQDEFEQQAAIDAHDKAMRNRGYMKAMDSYGNLATGGSVLREDGNCQRKIIANEYLKANENYYVRMRQIMEDGGVYPFSLIEIVPKNIYASDGVPEDKH